MGSQSKQMSRLISLLFLFCAIICCIKAKKTLKQHVKEIKNDLKLLNTFLGVEDATAITIVNKVTLPFSVTVSFYESTTEVSGKIINSESLGTLFKPQGATTVKKISGYSLIGTPHIGCQVEFPPPGSSSTVFGICSNDLFSCYICAAGPGCCVPVAT